MALLWIDGFDGASNTTDTSSNLDTEAYLEARYTVPTWSGANNPLVWTGWAGAGKALSFGRDGFADGNYIRWATGEIGTVYFGFAIRPGLGLPVTLTPVFARCRHVVDGQEHIRFQLYQGRHIVIRRGSTNDLGVIYNAFLPGRWSYFEARVTISDTVGVVEVHINGVQRINLTSQDTKEGAAGDDLDTVELGGIDGSTAENTQTLFDDFYICDSTGSTNNTFLGPIKVEELLPNGTGDSAQFSKVPTTATNNYENVDETPRDDDTSYNHSATTTNLDLFAATNLSLIDGTVFGVQIDALGRVDDATAFTLVPKLKRSTSEGTGTGVSLTNTTEYLAVSHVFEQDPAAGPGAWTVTNVNAMQIGYEVG